jgi:hypothetical protein
MEVRNVRWIGTATRNYLAMTQFARELLGLRVNFEEATSTEFVTVEGDALQVIVRGHPYYDFFGQHALGPVPLSR